MERAVLGSLYKYDVSLGKQSDQIIIGLSRSDTVPAMDIRTDQADVVAGK